MVSNIIFISNDLQNLSLWIFGSMNALSSSLRSNGHWHRAILVLNFNDHISMNTFTFFSDGRLIYFSTCHSTSHVWYIVRIFTSHNLPFNWNIFTKAARGNVGRAKQYIRSDWQLPLIQLIIQEQLMDRVIKSIAYNSWHTTTPPTWMHCSCNMCFFFC